MNRQLRKKSNRNPRNCSVINNAFEKTQNGLALTPAEMRVMASRGIPVSSTVNEALFYDGESNPSWLIPIDRVRGVDLTDVWNASMDAKKKLVKAHLNDKAKYN